MHMVGVFHSRLFREVFYFLAAFLVFSAHATQAQPTAASRGKMRQGEDSEKVTVHSKTELLSIIAELPWNTVGHYSSKKLTITPDIIISGAIEFASDELAVPKSCRQRSDCRQRVGLFMPAGGITGVVCKGKERVLWHQFCSAVVIRDTTIRFQAFLEDSHPARWNFVPILKIVSPSTASCTEGEFTCSAEMTCYRTFSEYCRLCLGLSKEQCACRGPKGYLPNGSHCHFMISGDLVGAGLCDAGVCIPRQ